jgi:hypothetical protein
VTRSKRDANEAALVELWRRLGCVTIPQAREAGFDLLVVCPRTGLHIVEVKDGSKRWKLTPAEMARCAEVQAAGACYSIVTNEAEALELVTGL